MKINLIANNGKPVTAEQGGGIDSRFSNIPALIANRDKAGIWEEFHLMNNSDGTVSFVTFNGDYITAEEGGGKTLSTNRTVAGPWEKFILRDGGILCNDLKHWITCEIGSNLTLNATRTVRSAWETFTIKNLEGGESGSLFKYGQFLYRNSNNTVFDWRGTSMFLVPDRYFKGEEIQSQINWMTKYGFNVARFFIAGVNWTGWDNNIYKNPNYQSVIATLLKEFNSSGIRIECTVVTYQGDQSIWRSVIGEINELMQQYPMNFMEVMNEPWSIWNNDAPLILTQGMVFNGLTAYGIQPSSPSRIAARDYITVHLPRDSRYFRNTKDLYEMRVGSEFYYPEQMPIVGDEPVGVIDPAYYPNYKQSGEFWVDQYGRGARVTDTNKIATAFAIARLFSMGCTYHTQAGLEGRTPSDGEVIHNDGARLIYEVCRFIPAEAQTGTYTRPGLPNFPVTFDTGYGIDHPYASILGGKTAYLVMTNANKNWIPKPVDGWKVEKIHPELNWLVKLVK